MRAIVEQLRRARAQSVRVLLAALVFSISHAAPPPQITVRGNGVFPESLTSTADGTVIIGSIGQRTIYRAKPGAAVAEPWIAPGTDGMQNILGVLADERSKTLWACSSTFPPSAKPSAPAALYAFDLETGAPKAHYPFPTAGALCNDIAVDADGIVYATDTSNMEVVRLPRGAQQLATWAGHGAFGPKGSLLDGIAILGRRVIVNTLATSRLFSVAIQPDGSAGTIIEVQLDQPLARPDGMRRFGHDGLLVAQGGAGGRLSRVILHGDRATVTLLKEGFPDGPVAVTVVGTTAYVLEGQLNKLLRPPTPNEPGSTVKPNPFRATAVEIGKP